MKTPVKQFVLLSQLTRFLWLFLCILAGSALSAQDASINDKSLLDFFNGLYDKTPSECPERMYVNNAFSSQHTLYRKILKGDFKAGSVEMEEARKELSALRSQIILGQKWPMKEREKFAIPFADEVPAINGDIDAKAWTRGLRFENEFALDSMTEIKSGIEWRLLWNCDALFVEAKVPDDKIVAFECGRPKDKYPWDADCIEIFVMPDPRMKEYWEIVVNPDGYVFDGLHCNNSRGWFVYRISSGMAGLKTCSKRIEGGYAIQTQIPFNELPNYRLGNRPEPGQSLYLALLRVEDGQRRSVRPLLYDGHNVFGYFKATLSAAEPAEKHKGCIEKDNTVGGASRSGK